MIPQPHPDDPRIATKEIATRALLEHHLVPTEHIVDGVTFHLPFVAKPLPDHTVMRFDYDDGDPGHSKHLGESEGRTSEMVEAILYDDQVVARIGNIHAFGVEERCLERGIEPFAQGERFARDIGDRYVAEASLPKERAFATDSPTYDEYRLDRHVIWKRTAERVKCEVQPPIAQVAS